MNIFLQIIVSLWVIMPCVTGIGYVIYLSSTKPSDWSCIVKIINLFGKVLLNTLYLFLCPVIAIVEWLIIGMTYHKGK